MTSSFGRLASIVLLCSTVAVSVSTAQTLASVASFDSTHGANPYSTVVLGADGNYYGTTYYGGANNYGTVYKMTPGGALTVLHTFANTDGARPYSSLTRGTDGNFYGTTELGGSLGGGSVFKITPAGALTTLYSFGGNGGTLPYGGLAEASDGTFYGTTFTGGANGKGTIFQITPSGVLTTIYSFAGTDGNEPYATMLLGSDGNFYGTTFLGGANNLGTVFQVTTSGALTTLYSFAGSDGKLPYASLVEGTDGNLYGTTSAGGTNNNGTVFQITTSGTLTTLHNFCSPTNCEDGSLPYAGLTLAPDGSFYGTASSGGHNDQGTVFNITSAGALTVLHAFTGSDGRLPYGAVVLAPNGSLYGTTNKGGTNSIGTIFNVSPIPYRFNAVTPCRLVDTRQTNPITGGTFQTFDLKQLSQQNGCGDLSGAALYSLNVTLVPVQGHSVGFLTIWPTGQVQPLVSTMNSLDGRVKANAAIVPGGTNGEVNVYVTDTANVVLDIDAYFGPVTGSTLAFYPLTPCRVADTRDADGSLGGPYLQAGQERDFPVRASNCGIPGNAQAYSLNLTAVPYNNQPLGFLTVWPTGQSQPLVSTLNNLTATVVANAAIVPAGTTGQIAVYPNDNTHLVIDINGYFAPAGQGGLSLYPDVPCRVIDTRDLGQPFNGTLTPPVDVVHSACIVPIGAQAYVFNATVVPAPTLGFLTLWPDSKTKPFVSTLNAVDGQITSNMAVVPNVNGKTDAFSSDATQLVLDISSYFAP